METTGSFSLRCLPASLETAFSARCQLSKCHWSAGNFTRFEKILVLLQ